MCTRHTLTCSVLDPFFWFFLFFLHVRLIRDKSATWILIKKEPLHDTHFGCMKQTWQTYPNTVPLWGSAPQNSLPRKETARVDHGRSRRVWWRTGRTEHLLKVCLSQLRDTACTNVYRQQPQTNTEKNISLQSCFWAARFTFFNAKYEGGSLIFPGSFRTSWY